DYRRPMPKWVTELDPTLRHRLNPNPTDAADALLLGQLFELMLTQPPYYLNDINRASNAAYSLAANVLAYTNNSVDPSDAHISAGGKEYYGIEPQPFFAEVVTLTIRKDRPDGTNPGEEDPGNTMI